MDKKNVKYVIYIYLFLFVLSFCKKEESKTIPVIVTNSLETITSNSVLSGGCIVSDGGCPITSLGVCWNETSFPTVSDAKTTDSLGSVCFSSKIAGLDPAHTYHVRAYASNSIGTAYGNDIVFRTDLEIPSITTLPISSITSNSALTGGTIISNGGDSIISCGVCWSLSTNPTITDSKTIDTLKGGKFLSKISNLTYAKNYHVRAYAINSKGTAYGEDMLLTTRAILPTVNTINISFITSKSAESEFNVVSDGGAAITSCGLCWGKNQDPSILTDNYSTNASLMTTSIQKENISSLESNTTYYIRAYSINEEGIAYGNQLEFTTLEGDLLDFDGNKYGIVQVQNYGQIWMLENLRTTHYNDGSPIMNIIDNNEWENTVSGSFCWFNNNVSNNWLGALYNFYAVQDSHKLCPTGWHVPQFSEWQALIDQIVGHSLFSMFQVGSRSSKGIFYISNYNCWWSSTEPENTDYAYYFMMLYRTSELGYYWTNKKTGYSVRCVKD